ncbi:MAG TPA: hypothetical protein VFA67_16205 [Candidatus Sulfotelmatobacter sp.]|nr:hypothetical protein [Candidatus Sulfotelmatobacter sp.]
MKTILLCLALICSMSAWLLASANEAKDKPATRTVTGCLQKTSEAGEFLLQANDGSSWEVKSDTVSLAPHVGHTISATGVVSHETAHNLKEDAKETAHDAGIKKENKEHGHLKITDVQMVSESCSQ